MAVLEVIVGILKFLGRLTGLVKPGTSTAENVANAVPKPLNTQARDKANALRTENDMLRADAERGDRVEEIRNDIEVKDEKGRPSGLDFSRTRRN